MTKTINGIFLLILLFIIITHYQGFKEFSKTFSDTSIKIITFLQGKY